MKGKLTLPLIPMNAHKYSRGFLLVIAGSLSYYGAAVLSTLAAEKGGAGYVTLATPLSAAHLARQHLLCSPVIEAPEKAGEGCFRENAFSTLIQGISVPNAICCGPGLTLNGSTALLVKDTLDYAETHHIPLLLDADALNALAEHPELLECRREGNNTELKIADRAQNKSSLSFEPNAFGENTPLILTPHAGEFERLSRALISGQKPNSVAADLSSLSVQERAHWLAQSYEMTVVAKGPKTFITNGIERLESANASPALAKAGTGDVLAGLMASLLAQGLPSFDAAVLGVGIHSRAGIIAEELYGRRSVTALNVIEALPQALQEFESTYSLYS